jgi:Na+/H+ antiporter NhaC
MDPLTIFMAVILLGLIVLAIRSQTPRGKARSAERDAQREAKSALVTDGKYKTSQQEKQKSILIAALLYAGIGGLLLAGPYFVGGLVVGALVGSLFGLFATAIATEAESKGRSYNSFFWLSMLLSPLVMWVVSSTISPLSGSAKVSESVDKRNTSIDVSDQIKKLSALKDEGILTKAEFEAKKRDLLDRI